jgi:hypothetical protein
MNNKLTTKIRAVRMAALAAALAAAASLSFVAPQGASAAPVHAGGSHPGGGHGHHALIRPRASRTAGWGLWGNGAMIYAAPQSPAIEPVAGSGTLSQHVTYTYDVPWDAVHRYPPALRTYEYAQGCRTDRQTVPGHSGGKQTVNITRCY